MPDIRYGVAIRSVRDNDFLRQTLFFLKSQSIMPEDVVIAIPSDVDPWKVDILPVRFVKAQRGMVTQRAAGIREAQGRYTLLLDDDIVLAPDAAERLIGSLLRNNAICAVPYWPKGWPKAGKMRWLFAFWGIAVPRSEGGVSYTLYFRGRIQLPVEGTAGSGVGDRRRHGGGDRGRSRIRHIDRCHRRSGLPADIPICLAGGRGAYPFLAP